MKHVRIKKLLSIPAQHQIVHVKGWIRTFRNNQFISLNDGSTIHNLQAVIEKDSQPQEILRRITTGSCVGITGVLSPSPGRGQESEVMVQSLEIIGDCDVDTYPLQPKKHSLEFLREVSHLRARTSTLGAVMRIRNALAYATHSFFQNRGFFYVHSPIITRLDAEGAGSLFKVTTLDSNNPPRNSDHRVNYTKDFFGNPTYLAVSGQLEGEAYALALGEIYTFGPTFRAENSNTTRHLAEFWMIEPEMAFYDLNDTIELSENYLHYVIKYVLKNCSEDLNFLDARAQKEEKNKPLAQRNEMTLLQRLAFIVENHFEQLSYTDALHILKHCSLNKKKKFQYPIENWGMDLQSEHERFLVEKHIKKPVVLFDYPKDIKAFYMRQNKDEKTVAAMDILFPSIGEIIGGSQREERYQKLLNRIHELSLPEQTLWWYLDLRRFGSAPHSGFGLGFERLVLCVTGMSNIRDVIPFPRYPGKADF